MKNIVFLWDYTILFDVIKSYKDYNKILIVDKSKKKSALEIYLEYFDKVVEVDDIYNKAEMCNVIKALISTAGNIDALIVPFEGLIEMGGYLRQQFNIPGMKEATSIKVRNKYIMKEEVRKNGIKTSTAKIIRSLEDIKEFANAYDYPVIIKPIGGFTTVDTYKLDNESALSKLYEATLIKYRDKLENGMFIVENYIRGEEYFCDSIVSEGQIVFSCVSKYLHNCIDTIIKEDAPVGGILFPSDCDETALIQRIKAVNKQVIEILNIDNSICHTEVFVDNDNSIYFGEIGARLGGGTVIPPCIQNTYNIDMYQAFIDVNLNRLSLPLTSFRSIYTGFIMLPVRKGTITEISKEEDFKDQEGLVFIKIDKKAGDIISSGKKSTVDKTGIAVFEADSFDVLKQRLLRIYEDFKLEVI